MHNSPPKPKKEHLKSSRNFMMSKFYLITTLCIKSKQF